MVHSSALPAVEGELIEANLSQLDLSHKADIAQFEQILAGYLQPQAEQLDHDPIALKTAFQWLGGRSLLALRLPTDWGGAGWSDVAFRRFQASLARYSGALAFLQTQHQSAGSLLLQSQNRALQERYLPYLGSGQKSLGVGFSHLRRQGQPAVVAEPVAEGYRLTGTVPWVTGFGIFAEFIVAATLPDGRAVYGVVPFADSLANGGQDFSGELADTVPQLQVGIPMPLAAMTATNTVTVTFQGWRLDHEQVCAIQPAEAIHIRDQRQVLQPSFLALGCAEAGLDVVRGAAGRGDRSLMAAALQRLTAEVSHCRTRIEQAEETGTTDAQKVALRARAIGLAVRCAHAAVVVSAGAANSLNHPAQRIYREALLFSVAGQTETVMTATLEQLAKIETERIW
jgi:alkylation response protein AidB-like acyl-CoA dehydrogenase